MIVNTTDEECMELFYEGCNFFYPKEVQQEWFVNTWFPAMRWSVNAILW